LLRLNIQINGLPASACLDFLRFNEVIHDFGVKGNSHRVVSKGFSRRDGLTLRDHELIIVLADVVQHL